MDKHELQARLRDEYRPEFDRGRVVQDASIRKGGGRYDARQNDDGTWDVLDVEVVANRPVPVRGRGLVELSTDWLRAALMKHSIQAKEGHLPPLHIRHHEPGVETELAGAFLPKDIKLGTYEGEQAHILVADLIGIPPHVYEQIRSGELSYRSAEIVDIDDPEISSLALLRDETPWFRLPMVTIGREARLINDPVGDDSDILGPVYMKDSVRPMVACRALGPNGTQALSRFGDITMTDTKKDVKLADNGEEKEDDAEEVEVNLMDDLSANELVQILEDALPRVKQILEGEGESEMMDDEEDAEMTDSEKDTQAAEDEEPKPKHTAPVELTAAAAKDIVTLKAENQSLKDRIDRMEAEKVTEKTVQEASAKLRAYGLSAAEAEREVRGVIKEHGVDVVDTWLSARISGLTPEPDMNPVEFGQDAPEELAEFANDPQKLERGIQLKRQYDQLRQIKPDIRPFAEWAKDAMLSDKIIRRNGASAQA